MPKIKVIRLVVAFLTLSTSAQLVAAQEAKRPFTVADDIELSQLLPDTPNVRFSPNGQYFAVYSERGHLDLNTVEDSLRFYRSQEIEKFLAHSLVYRNEDGTSRMEYLPVTITRWPPGERVYGK